MHHPEMTMTVRIIDRSTWGTHLPYPWIRTVDISTRCPRCGARRGQPRAHRFPEDGGWYEADTWENPCGHVDTYERVLAEVGRDREMEKP